MSPAWKRVNLVAQIVLAVALAALVGNQFARILAAPGFALPPLRWPWLVPAGLLYLAAHTIFGTFWWLLLGSVGVRVPWATGVRAYFVSQFGKYVPGKVWVIALRIALLRDEKAAFAVGVTGVYETLVNMAAGALLAAVAVPFTGGSEVVSGLWWILAGIALLPVGLYLLLRLVKRVARAARDRPTPPVRLLLRGLLQAAGGWCLLAGSLWCVLQAVVPDPPAWDADALVRCLAGVTASYVGGFLVLVSPGGLGPREWLVKELLRAWLTEPTAVVVSLVLRLVWTAFEVVLAAALYPTRWRRRPTDDPA